MQRVLLLLLTLFALYACTVPQIPAIEKSAAVAEAVKPPVDELISPEVFGATPPPVVVAGELKPAPVLPTEEPVPHIALLLPLISADFGSSADAVRQGFMVAAQYKKQLLPVRVYSDFDENSNVVNVYRQAIANGAVAVVGPLTRNGVAALAAEKDIPVPTLALNIVESQPTTNMYFFGLSIEAEARQAAQLAKQQGLHQAIIVYMHTSLSQRLQSAFEDGWAGSGRGVLREIEFNNDPAVFADIADISDTMIYLATDAEKARLIRPYLPSKVPVYASSQIFSGNEKTLTNYDMNGIRFVDMPWLLQPDHPAVMIYSRANPPLTIAHERLYALGIDAFRIMQLMIANKISAALPLDGVSGRITLNSHVFQREAISARFVEGQARLADTPFAPAAQLFPDQPAVKP